MGPTTSKVITGFGRQKVYPVVGQCIYCFATPRDLGDEHIIPQALGGNIILPRSCCRRCEGIIGGGLEKELLHKRYGMFAALRLRIGYKSRRPKDRPTGLPFTFIDDDGTRRTVEIPADKVPKHWTTFTTLMSPGIILGLDPRAPTIARLCTQVAPEDLEVLAAFGNRMELRGSGKVGDIARFLAKIAHAAAVAEYGLASFEPWLPNFILGIDKSEFGYYVAGHANAIIETEGDHRITLGTWEDDGIRIGASVRLFCKWGGPDYEIAVGRFKEVRKERPTT